MSEEISFKYGVAFLSDEAIVEARRILLGLDPTATLYRDQLDEFCITTADILLFNRVNSTTQKIGKKILSGFYIDPPVRNQFVAITYHKISDKNVVETNRILTQDELEQVLKSRNFNDL